MKAREIFLFAASCMLATVASAQVSLRVEKQPELMPEGTLRFFWTGGIADFDAYESVDPRRVVAPNQGFGNTADMEILRPPGAGDLSVMYFKVACPGGGCDEVCFDDVDNDGDGDVDCDDSDCSGSVDCDVEVDCTDGLDNEGDGLIDCADPDCPAACDDGDPCTVDTCDAMAPGGCVITQVVCDDGDACNGLETCEALTGDCLPGMPVACDDGDACNGLETCDSMTGDCLAGTDVDCSDGDPCTDDVCEPTDGTCTNPDKVCEDADACNGVETCDAPTGDCLPGVPVVCDDGDACNGLETCDTMNGDCLAGMDVDCGDGDPCTDDLCEPTDGSCTNPDKACDDLDACNGVETCDAMTGDCLPGMAVVCDDGDACNGLETCDAMNGDCLPGVDVDCGDGDLCTDDLCEPTDGTCTNPDKACDDGDACNGVETCDAMTGDCLPGMAVDCSDGDPCTQDVCEPTDGTCSNPILVCDDDDPCTVDSCDAMLGCVTEPVDCSDGDPCTDDVCDPMNGCEYPATDCDDGDACTTDSCDPGMGCVHVPEPNALPGSSAELAGNILAAAPSFDTVLAYNVDASVSVAIDPGRFPDVVDETCDVYVLTARSAADWCADASLTDARGAPDTRTFVAGTIAMNSYPLVAPGQLSADAGTGLGVGYDVALDCDQDGQLGPGDYRDGTGREAGFYLVHDLTQLGPLATATFDEIGPAPTPPSFPTFEEGDDMRIYYPATLEDPTFVGTYPLVVISHGNGHNFAWYDFLQEHLASYGYIAMSHDNNTETLFDSITSASTSTLTFTDRILDEQGTLGPPGMEGILDGHIDARKIVWIGHSRGGEGVARAYDRLFEEGYTPAQYSIDDILLVNSIAPTDFEGFPLSNSHGVPYALLYGAGDGDVNGCAGNPIGYGFNIFERSVGSKSSAYVHGASHNDFNECGQGPNDGTGPDQPGCVEVQKMQKAFTLALVQHRVWGNIPARDFLWRQYESIRPIGVAATVVVDNDYQEPPNLGLIVDDYQSNADPTLSSSGGAVSYDGADQLEDLLSDGDASFDWVVGDPMNGMTRSNLDIAPNDTQSGVVLEFTADATYELTIVPAQADVSAMRYLSFRACQMPRHPQTLAADEDLTFTVTLTDGLGGSSSVGIGAYGGGLEEPYARTDCGTSGDPGWQVEFEVIRIRLADFLNDGSGLDLTDLASIRFQLGPSFGSAVGRIGLDDVRFLAD